MKGKIMLSEHFSLEEMSYSRIAVEQAIDNEPPEAEREAMRHLAIHLLEPLRLLYGAPIAILSGFRNRKVNHLAGGVVNSQHCRGEAADCYTPDLARLLTVLRSSGLVFDQAIYYCKRNFLHLSLKKSGANRMQVLFYVCCFAFLLQGCGSHRQTNKQKQLVYADTTGLKVLQALHGKRDFHLTDTMVYRLCQVVYSPPDSSGGQFPRVVTTVETGRYRQIADTGKVMASISGDYTRQQTGTVSTETKTQHISSGYIRPLLLIIGFGLVGVFFAYRTVSG